METEKGTTKNRLPVVVSGWLLCFTGLLFIVVFFAHVLVDLRIRRGLFVPSEGLYAFDVITKLLEVPLLTLSTFCMFAGLSLASRLPMPKGLLWSTVACLLGEALFLVLWLYY